jgi:hypothetical protein
VWLRLVHRTRNLIRLLMSLILRRSLLEAEYSLRWMTHAFVVQGRFCLSLDYSSGVMGLIRIGRRQC